jgi:cytidine deaminase
VNTQPQTTVSLPDQERVRLVDAAIRARQRAYAPYSNYHVGAALLGESGIIYTGCNVENASYGATICAERTAVVKAVSEGEYTFKAVAVVTANGGTPCGICRQVLSEFAPEMWVIIADPEGRIHREYTLSALLPDCFGPAALALPSTSRPDGAAREG